MTANSPSEDTVRLLSMKFKPLVIRRASPLTAETNQIWRIRSPTFSLAITNTQLPSGNQATLDASLQTRSAILCTRPSATATDISSSCPPALYEVNAMLLPSGDQHTLSLENPSGCMSVINLR